MDALPTHGKQFGAPEFVPPLRIARIWNPRVETRLKKHPSAHGTKRLRQRTNIIIGIRIPKSLACPMVEVLTVHKNHCPFYERFRLHSSFSLQKNKPAGGFRQVQRAANLYQIYHKQDVMSTEVRMQKSECRMKYHPP